MSSNPPSNNNSMSRSNNNNGDDSPAARLAVLSRLIQGDTRDMEPPPGNGSAAAVAAAPAGMESNGNGVNGDDDDDLFVTPETAAPGLFSTGEQPPTGPAVPSLRPSATRTSSLRAAPLRRRLAAQPNTNTNHNIHRQRLILGGNSGAGVSVFPRTPDPSLGTTRVGQRQRILPQQMQQRRTLRVPRGAHITIHQHPPQQPQSQAHHLAVPVAELQPAVLAEQLLRQDDDNEVDDGTPNPKNPPEEEEEGSSEAATLGVGTVIGDSDGNDTAVAAKNSSAGQAPLEKKPSAGAIAEKDPNANNNDKQDLEHFKCSICYDYLDHPVGCGQCSGRFCETCLYQVLGQPPQAASNNSNSNQPPKCPTCRAPFNSAVPDRDLRAKMAQISLPCIYAACPRDDSHPVPLLQYKAHEAECAGVRVACRYAPYGCPWKGFRSELAAHESSDCTLARVPGLLEQFRTMQVQHRREVSAMQQQTAFLLNSIGALEAALNNMTMYHRSNPLHLVSFATSAMVSTVRMVSSNRTMWKSFYHSADARANVFNALALLPTALLIVKVVDDGIRLHCHAWTWEKVMLLWRNPDSLLQGWATAFGAINTNSSGDEGKEISAANSLLDHLIMTW